VEKLRPKNGQKMIISLVDISYVTACFRFSVKFWPYCKFLVKIANSWSKISGENSGKN